MPSQGISQRLSDEIQRRLPVGRPLTDEDFAVTAGQALKECSWAFDPFNSNDAALRALVDVDQ
jgi:hypothetical protein